MVRSFDTLAPLSPRPFRAPLAPTLSSSSFRRCGETGVQLFLDSPPRGCELPLRLQRRAQPFLLCSYASWGQDGVGGTLLRGRKGERPRLTRAFAGGAGVSPQSACRLLPHPMAPRQRLKSGSWRASPPPSFFPGTSDGGRGRFWCRGLTYGEAPARRLMFPPPSPSGSWQLQRRGPSHLLRVPGRASLLSSGL